MLTQASLPFHNRAHSAACQDADHPVCPDAARRCMAPLAAVYKLILDPIYSPLKL